MEQNTIGPSNQDELMTYSAKEVGTSLKNSFKRKYDGVIIDPTSPEVNRGSFCYLPYLLYSALGLKNEIRFMEDFTMTQIDSVPEAKQYLVALWSYPQIDLCLMLNKFLPKQPKFFGYEPLIKHLKLPFWNVDNEIIEEGMCNYPQVYPAFNHLLLSDCDMHLKKYEGQVYPLFTSYGCPRGCAFCPSTINCHRKRIALDVNNVRDMLKLCWEKKIYNIHFTDEDFFFDTDRAYYILNEAAILGNFNFIALGEVTTVNKFIDRHGNEALRKSGMKLIEIGMETADPELGKVMGKAPVFKCRELSDKCHVDIFWLTLTFFPGETLKTLNETGNFLRKHGFNPEELYGRIRTNGTEGGLGQFFQPYHGTKNFKDLKKLGKVINSRPMRLLPSYLPNSFLSQLIHKKRLICSKDDYWFKLYRVPQPAFHEGHSIWEAIRLNLKEGISIADSATFYAICARLGII